MDGQAGITADALYGVFTFSPMLFIGAVFLGIYMKATRRESGEAF
jgi:hypothetical protein